MDCIGKEELENTLEGMKESFSPETPEDNNAVHNYGLALVHNLKYKEANTNLKMALDLAEARKDTANIIDIKLTLASSHQYAGDNRTSAALYEEAFKLDSTLFPIPDYGIWGLASVHTGDIKNAEKRLSVISGDLQSDVDSIVWYNLRCRLAAARGDYKSALALKDSAFSHSDHVVAQQFDFNLLHSEKQFLNEKSRLNAEIAQQKERLLIISVIGAILLIVSSLLAIYIINNKRKHKISIQQQEIKRIQTLLQKNEERVFEKDELIANLEKTIAELRDRLSRLNEESRSLRDDICRKENELNIRNEENSRLQYINDLEKNFFSLKTDAIGRELSAKTEKIRDLEESMESYRSLAVSSYRKANLDASQILADMEAAVGASRSGKYNPALEKLREELNSDKAFARIYQEVDCLMENVMSKISAEFNPEPKSKLIILLTLAGFGYRGIATITGMNPSTVSSIKTRLTGKLLKSGSAYSVLYEKYL